MRHVDNRDGICHHLRQHNVVPNKTSRVMPLDLEEIENSVFKAEDSLCPYKRHISMLRFIALRRSTST